ncbi:MAG: squalene/phytoene synthase family protein, partial [Pseudomonadota bacterium]
RLSACAQIARNADPDRFFCMAFAPLSQRESLFTLMAFNHEVAKTRSVVSEALLGRIRLQWWREAIEECLAAGDGGSNSSIRHHEVVQPLAAIIQETPSVADDLFDVIEAREADLEEPPTTAKALVHYAEAVNAPLNRAFARVLLDGDGDIPNEWICSLSAAWGLISLLRSSVSMMTTGWSPIPPDVLEQQGVDLAALQSGRRDENLPKAVAEISTIAERLLTTAKGELFDINRTTRRKLKPIVLQSTMTQGYLKRLKSAGYDPFDIRVVRPSTRVRLSVLSASMF